MKNSQELIDPPSRDTLDSDMIAIVDNDVRKSRLDIGESSLVNVSHLSEAMFGKANVIKSLVLPIVYQIVYAIKERRRRHIDVRQED